MGVFQDIKDIRNALLMIERLLLNIHEQGCKKATKIKCENKPGKPGRKPAPVVRSDAAAAALRINGLEGLRTLANKHKVKVLVSKADGRTRAFIRLADLGAIAEAEGISLPKRYINKLNKLNQ